MQVTEEIGFDIKHFYVDSISYKKKHRSPFRALASRVIPELHLAILIKVDIIKQFILQLSSVKNPAWGTSPVWNCLEIFWSGVALFNFLRSEIGKNHFDDFGLSCRGLGAKLA